MEPIVSDVRGCEGKGSNLFCHSSLATHTKGHSCLEENRSKIGVLGHLHCLFATSIEAGVCRSGIGKAGKLKARSRSNLGCAMDKEGLLSAILRPFL
jgi:hypothetical protein